MDEALRQDGGYGTDYVLRDDAMNCWINVRRLSVCITPDQDGIKIEVLPRSCNLDGPVLLQEWVSFGEAECPEEEL